MIGVFILLGVFGVAYLVAYGSPKSAGVAIAPLKEKPEKRCPPHKWTYNHEDRLQCTVCSLRAGEVKTEGGNY